MNSPLIRTLVVDDSAFVRKVVREMLVRSGAVDVVGLARDGQEALEMAAELKPDVVTCDLNMPRVGGLEFVRRQMAIRPIPILILSASPSDGELVLEAMNAGAVDFVQKPSALATNQLLDLRSELVEKVRTAARAPIRNLHLPVPIDRVPVAAAPVILKVDAVVVGISTGGPQALRYFIPQFPATFPVPLAVVLHMPVGYTEMFAAKLGELSKLQVGEARDGAVFLPGAVVVAQAGRHLVLARNSRGEVLTRLVDHPLDKPHRPSVDVLFESAAQVYGPRILAIVMTGMGDDGKLGAACIKKHGGTVLTESHSSCVIYGMPRSVDEAGLSDASVPLPGMAEAIMKYL